MRRLVLLGTLILVACSGGGGASSPASLPVPTPAASASASPKTGNLALSITIPMRKTSGKQHVLSRLRGPQYVPSGGTQLTVALTGTQSLNLSFTLSTECTSSTPGTYTCSANVPPGNYSLLGQILDANANLLATSANVTPTASIAVRGGTNSATISLQGVVSIAYVQTALLCYDPTTLASGLPLRFLDADGEEISGTFAYPVTLTSSDVSALHVASTSGTNLDSTPITSDTTVTSTAYPTTPGYVLAGNGSTEDVLSMQVSSGASSPIAFYDGAANMVGAILPFLATHHILAVGNQGNANVGLYGIVQESSTGDVVTESCGNIATPLTNVSALITDGANDAIVVAGTSAADSPDIDVSEYRLQPSSSIVSLSGSFPSVSVAGENSLQAPPMVGTLSLARSAATHRVYLGVSAESEILVFNDASFPGLGSTNSYFTGSPTNLVVGAPLSLAVVNTSNNGDVLLIPNSNNSGVTPIGIVTHAENAGTSVGFNFDIHTVTPDGPDPLPSYSTASYSNGSTRILSFMLNDNGSGQLHSFDATFASTPTINRAAAEPPQTMSGGLVTGSGDTDYFYASTSGSAEICFAGIGNPMGFPFNCDPSGGSIQSTTNNTMATSGDNTYLAVTEGTGIAVYNPSAISVPVASLSSLPLDTIPAFYVR